ncbi:MAG: PD-(D/E)XK nuclease family protein [Acidobacteriota bacterium]
MPELVSALAAICREHLLTEKILVAPSLAIGHQIADAIAHSGTSWVNLRVETIRTLADAIAGFTLAGEGCTVLSRAQALAIVERSCDQALDSSSYFAALAGRPGLHRAIQRSLDDLRHAGVDLADLPHSAFEDSRKADDLARVLASYETELRERRFIDRYGVLARAIALLQSGAPRPWPDGAKWLVIDGIDLTSSEERFLGLVTGSYEVLSGGSAVRPERIDFRKAIGEENEIRGAFRTLLASGWRFDEAEIVYTTSDAYLPLTYEIAAEHEVPCTFAEGIPAYFTRPGQACAAFLDWIGSGWRASALQRGAVAGAISVKDLPGSAFARVLRWAAVGWGRDRYSKRLDALLAERAKAVDLEEDETRRESLLKSIDLIRATRAAIETMLVLTAEIAEGDAIDGAAAARAAAEFVRNFDAVRGEIDVMAREALVRVLMELAVLPGEPIDRAEVAARLTESMRRVHVSASNPRPGFLHVAPLRLGGWSGRPRTFVVGLDESRHPGSGLQDPIVLDAERVEINRIVDPHKLLLMGDAPLRAGRQFRQFLGRASSSELTLSWCALDLATRREQFPSAALLEVYRAVSGHVDATYAEVAGSVVREGFVDPTPISASGWWLMRRFADGEADLAAAVFDTYPALADGALAEEARDSDALTAWDGLVRPDGDSLDPRRNGRVYSASQLETMALCPYRYFLQRVLQVRPLEDIEFEPDQWLQAHQFGSLLHDVLQTTMERLCSTGEKPSLAFLAQMEGIAAEALQHMRDEIPPPSDAAYERRRSELLMSCEVFLRSEEEACRTVRPRFFEVSFGFGERGADTIAMPEPFSLGLGAGREVLLRGRIDRIDHDEASDEWHVWDYKSGGTWQYDKGGHLQRGTKVQHAIYPRALRAMLDGKGERGAVTRSGYFFPTSKGRGARLVPRMPDDLSAPTPSRQLELGFNALFDVIGSGFFPHASAPNPCSWCDFESVCGGAEIAGVRMQRKLAANSGDERVAAWLRLQDVR